MNRPVSLRAYGGAAGYTLVEMLVATALTLMLMGAVVAMFGRVSEGITDSRAMLEAAERLRLAATRLQMDLTGVTVTLSNPWCRPENNLGYFEYIEGPKVGSANVPDDTGTAEPMMGDSDDVVMFTTRSTGRPFVKPSGQSDVAEVVWYVNGHKLYRHVELVGTSVANTLGELTKRERRFAHDSTTFPFPFNASRLPALPDDIILTNVIGFDVKAWDPAMNAGAGGYVDLSTGNGQFSVAQSVSRGGTVSLDRVYSTWPTHYEYVGAPGLTGTPGQAVNGFDDGSGIVDGAAELLTAPPYPYPLRGIQVKIRVFEPDSQQVREVTVVQDFLP